MKAGSEWLNKRQLLLPSALEYHNETRFYHTCSCHFGRCCVSKIVLESSLPKWNFSFKIASPRPNTRMRTSQDGGWRREPWPMKSWTIQTTTKRSGLPESRTWVSSLWFGIWNDIVNFIFTQMIPWKSDSQCTFWAWVYAKNTRRSPFEVSWGKCGTIRGLRSRECPGIRSFTSRYAFEFQKITNQTMDLIFVDFQGEWHVYWQARLDSRYFYYRGGQGIC